MHVFAYGSLLNPGSLRATLAHLGLEACLPARLPGYLRCFDVAFPNDGSQPDKRYEFPDGSTPPGVLLGNIRPSEHYAVNGIAIPIDDGDLDRLNDRERRYDLVDVSGRAVAYPGGGPLAGRVLTFVGKPEFAATRFPGAVASRAYLDVIIAGAKHWDAVAPEFYHLTMACTEFPTPGSIAELERINL